MKVLQVIAGGPKGGAERFYTRLVLGLEKAGVEQKLIARPTPEWRTLFAPHGLKPIEARFPRIGTWQTKRVISNAVDEFKPDIVMTWMARASHLCPRGNFVHIGRLGGYYKLKYFQKCDHLIGNTEDIRDYFVREGWPREASHYLPNFVDTPADIAAASREEFATPEDAPVIFALGRLHVHKGFDVLVRALKNIPKAYLWLAGTGPLDDELHQLAVHEGVANRVRFLRWQSNPTQFFKACDVFVCPSRHEPLGNVVLEGWAHDCPVIATASEGPSSLITTGKNGYLTPLDDAEGLAQRVNDVLRNPKLAQKLIKGGSETLNDNFSEKSVVARYIKFFESVLSPN